MENIQTMYSKLEIEKLDVLYIDLYKRTYSGCIKDRICARCGTKRIRLVSKFSKNQYERTAVCPKCWVEIIDFYHKRVSTFHIGRLL